MSNKDIIQGALFGIKNLLNIPDAERKAEELREVDLAANSFKYVAGGTVANGFKTVTSGLTDVVSQVEGSVPSQASYVLGVVQLDKSAAKSELVKVVGSDESDLASITGNAALSKNGFLDVNISAPFPEAIAETIQSTTNLKPDQIKSIVNKNVNTENFTDGVLDTVVGDVIKSTNSLTNVLNNSVASITSQTNVALGKISFGFDSLLENVVEQSFQSAQVTLDSVAKIGDVVKTVDQADLKKIIELKNQGRISEAAKILAKYSDSPTATLEQTIRKVDNRAAKALEPEPINVDIPTRRTDNYLNLWREEFTSVNSKIFDSVIRTEEVETELSNLRREVTEVIIEANGVEDDHITVQEVHEAYVEKYEQGINPHFYITKYGIIHRARPLEVEAKPLRDSNDNAERSIVILLEGTRAPLASKTMRELKKLLASIYRAKPGIQVFGYNQVNPGEQSPYFDVPRYIKNTFGKYNVSDYNPSKDTPLTQKELLERRG